MKKYINRNILWSEFIVQQLANHGIKNVCISPGSRSTPLTIAFAEHKKLKKHIIIDERSSAFYALGLAKSLNQPVAVLTTSGTAAAELYPAIIEAHFERIPLIAITADRPKYLRNTGSNQTINQENIFKNHVVKSIQFDLPNVKFRSFIRMKNSIAFALKKGLITNRGSVHFNIPFDKPFEPSHSTDKVESEVLHKIKSLKFVKPNTEQKNQNIKIDLAKIQLGKRPVILVGKNGFDKSLDSNIIKLARTLNAPVLSDGASPLRLSDDVHVIKHHSSFLRSKQSRKVFEPTSIIQFGSAPTSSVMLSFFKDSKANKILVHEFGDRNDPSRTANYFIRSSVKAFCDKIIQAIKSTRNFETEPDWLHQWMEADRITESIKHEIFADAEYPFEGRIVTQLFDSVPDNCNVMVSNSLPVRDLDFFASQFSKNIHVYSNRGASGIDGITSTAAGIAASTNRKTFLLTGDLAFFHDLTGLQILAKSKIPLIIILINNEGGAIFEMLPVVKEKLDFKKYFKTPSSVNYGSIVKAFGGGYYSIKDWKDYNKVLNSAMRRKNFSVLEFMTDSKKSNSIRKKFWKQTVKSIDSWINENSIQ